MRLSLKWRAGLWTLEWDALGNWLTRSTLFVGIDVPGLSSYAACFVCFSSYSHVSDFKSIRTFFPVYWGLKYQVTESPIQRIRLLSSKYNFTESRYKVTTAWYILCSIYWYIGGAKLIPFFDFLEILVCCHLVKKLRMTRKKFKPWARWMILELGKLGKLYDIMAH